MDLLQLGVRLIVAIACAGIANIFIPRQIPGKFVGLIIVGLLGVWLGEWGFHLLKKEYSIDFGLLHWQFQSVPIIPSVLGSAVIIFVVTTLLKWTGYDR